MRKHFIAGVVLVSLLHANSQDLTEHADIWEGDYNMAANVCADIFYPKNAVEVVASMKKMVADELGLKTKNLTQDRFIDFLNDNDQEMYCGFPPDHIHYKAAAIEVDPDLFRGVFMSKLTLNYETENHLDHSQTFDFAGTNGNVIDYIDYRYNKLIEGEPQQESLVGLRNSLVELWGVDPSKLPK